MDFFAQQDKARSKTGLLVLLFIFAVVLVTLAVYAVTMVVVILTSDDPEISFFDPDLFFIIAGLTFVVIFIGSMMKMASLSKGGDYLAEKLGGEFVNPATGDPDERKLINVVEEMALASGVPVPSVYLLKNEGGINAFAAGFSFNDAAIGVTRGCCKLLSRDELQGVIAHEFSHILNGDMRLNIRLIGFLGGIMSIASIGKGILRGGYGHRHYSSRTRGGGGFQGVILAILLLAVGYTGVLIGRLIQSAVSRQREYLADASAVQFTRHTGIADALKKIGGLSSGSKINAAWAEEASHMFFGKAVSSLFATHPPLIDRITRIEPGFKGAFEVVKEAPLTPVFGGPQPTSSFQPGQEISTDADTVMKQVGNITPENVVHSAAVLARIPEAIKNETHDILGAFAVVCALLLDKDPAQKKKQLDMLSRSAPESLVRQLKIVDKYVSGISPELRLPIIDIAIPTLRQMSARQFDIFKKHIQALIEADSKITIFEFTLKEVLNHRLEAAFENREQKIIYKDIKMLKEDAVALLSLLAQAGHKDREVAGKAFRAALSSLPIKGGSKIEMPQGTSFTMLHTALERFSQSSFGVRETFFDACCHCVLFDEKVAINEAELLRAVAYALDIPLPPFMTKQ